MASDSPYFDVCILCAMAEEAEAVIEVVSRQRKVRFEQAFSSRTNREYRHTTIRNNKGEPLSIHLSWPLKYGLIETSLHLKSVLDEYRPRFAAMTGICAGDRRKVKLGDLIVAERAFTYDSGKFVLDEQGRRVHLHDADPRHPDPDALQYAQMFTKWKRVVARLPRPPSKRQQREWLLSKLLENGTPHLDDIPQPELTEHAPDWRRIVQELQTGQDAYLTKDLALRDKSRVQMLRFGSDEFPFQDPPRAVCYIAPMASGSAVRSDDPFREVQFPVRGTIAVEMEGTAFYRTVGDFPGIRSLLVKGVSDYADRDKDDSYHKYAAEASAMYILCFIKGYVTAELMPRVQRAQQLSQSVVHDREEADKSQTPLLHEVADDPRPSNSKPIQAIPPCPYRGLSAFQERDAPYFFGRTRVVDQLTKEVQKKAFVAVIGPSGSGKSSLILAGLIPQLRSMGEWLIAHFRPIKEPFRNLAQALTLLLEPEVDEVNRLAHANSMAVLLDKGDIALAQVIRRIREKHATTNPLLLIIDQFEELFSPELKNEERDRFLAMLLSVVQPIRQSRFSEIVLLITLRADFLGYALSCASLASLLQRDYKITPMTRDEMRDVIERPAQKLNTKIADGLTRRILDAISTGPGNLPLLEFALTLLWEKQQNGELTHSSYETIGGVERALANHADQVFERLDGADKLRIPRILVQLVHPGFGTEDTRRRATKAEIGEENWDLVSYLASNEARLVTTEHDDLVGQDTVELIHEALIKEWKLLQQWIDEYRSFRIWQERIRAAISQWKDAKYSRDLLLRGSLLAEAEEWVNKQHDVIGEMEKQFIQLSRKEKTRSEDELRELYEKAKQQQKEAEEQRIIALSRQLSAQAELLRNQRPHLLQRSVLLAIEAMRRSPSLEADQPLRYGLALLLHPISRISCGKDIINIAFSPNSRYIAGASDDKTARIWEAHSGKEVLCLEHEDILSAIAFNPDGDCLMTVSQNRITHLWAIESGLEIMRWEHTSDISANFFSPDGNYLATVSSDQTLWLRDLRTGNMVMKLRHADEDVIWSAIFSPDGRYIATAGGDRRPRSGTLIWAVHSGIELRHLVHEPIVQNIAFSPDGYYMATASADGNARVWAINTGNEVMHISHDDLGMVAYSPDGRYLVTTSTDGFRLWLATSGQLHREVILGPVIRKLIFSFDGQYIAFSSADDTVSICEVDSGRRVVQLLHYGVFDLAFSPDGRYLATASGFTNPDFQDFSARLWEVPSGREVGRMQHGGPVFRLSFDTDGRYLVTASYDGTARLWAVQNGQEIIRYSHEQSVYRVAFSFDGQLLATMTRTAVYLWEVQSGHEIAHLSHEGTITSMAFDPNGRYIATASMDGITRIWSVQSYDLMIQLLHGGVAWEIAFSVDGTYLIGNISPGQSTVRIWESHTGAEVALMHHRHNVTALAFSPSGKYLVTAGVDHIARLWTVDGQELAGFSQDKHVEKVAFSFDGRYLYTTDNENLVYIWDVKNRLEVSRLAHKGRVRTIAFSPNGYHVLTVSSDNIARFWTLDGHEVARVSHDKLLLVALSPDGKLVATVNAEQTIQVWDACPGGEVAVIRHDGALSILTSDPRQFHLATVPQANNTTFPVGGIGNNIVQIWDGASGSEIARLSHQDALNAVSYSFDGSCLVTSSVDNITIIWNNTVEGYKEVRRLMHEESTIAQALSLDGLYLATAFLKGIVQISSAADGNIVQSFVHELTIAAMSFTSDAKHLILASLDGIIQIMQIFGAGEVVRINVNADVRLVKFSSNGAHMAVLTVDNLVQIYKTDDPKDAIIIAAEDIISEIALDQNGEHLATVESDGLQRENITRVWEIASGREIARIMHDHSVIHLVFSANGRYLATTGDDYITRVWFWHFEDLISEACSRLTRNLTLEEWRTYLRDEPYNKTCSRLS